MKIRHAGLVAIAALAFAGPVLAKATSLNCPRAAASEERMAALEDQLGALEDRLAMLDDKLTALADVRRDALERAKAQVQAAVHAEGASQEQIDAAVSHALQQAQVAGEVTAHQARAAHQAMDAVRTQMEALRQQMRSRAAHEIDKDADAG